MICAKILETNQAKVASYISLHVDLWQEHVGSDDIMVSSLLSPFPVNCNGDIYRMKTLLIFPFGLLGSTAVIKFKIRERKLHLQNFNFK